MNLFAHSALIISVIFFALASLLSFFLYFRSGNHELVDDEVLFDSAAVGLIGGLLGGRIADFLLRADYYNFLPSKLLFFNVYSGFDWYGALLGSVVAIYIFLKKKKVDFLYILDLACVPLVFGGALISLGNYLIHNGFIAGIYTAVLLIVFWVLKRLAKIKRNSGFFLSLVLILISILNLSIYPLSASSYLISNRVEYYLIMPVICLSVGVLLLYFISKRKHSRELKNLIALLLLGVFKLKRVLTSISEANLAAKAIVFSPLHLSKLVLNLVKLLGREIQLSAVELVQVFGGKK